MKKKILITMLIAPLAIHYFNYCITGLAVITIVAYMALKEADEGKYWYLKRPVRGILLYRIANTVKIEEVEGVKSYMVITTPIHKVLVNGEIKYRKGILLKYNKTLMDTVRKMPLSELQELYQSLEKNVFVK